MSEVTSKTCRELAVLARLAIDDHEATLFAMQLERVLDHLDQLQGVDVRDVPEYGLEHASELREDVVGETLPLKVVLSAAPRSCGDHILVPKFKDD